MTGGYTLIYRDECGVLPLENRICLAHGPSEAAVRYMEDGRPTAISLDKVRDQA
jgi:hypothetical protein